LDRDLNVFARFWKTRHSIQEALRHIRGVGGQEPKALKALYLVDGPDQVGQINRLRKVLPVGVYVLAKEGDLASPAPHPFVHIAKYLVEATAAHWAAPQGHYAVGAEVVATAGDGNVGGDGHGREQV
jgi:hypothetical protein